MIKGGQPGMGFDLAGTCIGSVRLDQIITGKDIRPGDVLIGVEASGIHSNGLTLARRAFPDLHEHVAELGRSAGEELLEPTTIYVRGAMAVLDAGIRPRALAHITGDGYLNLLRVEAEIAFEIDNLPEPPAVFGVIQARREVPLEEMYRVFNMGIGFVAVVDPKDADETIRLFGAQGHRAGVIGRAVAPAPEPFVRLTQARLLGDGASFTPY
jgi:phosphoribosylformylglycinamidine cyclo-ligase